MENVSQDFLFEEAKRVLAKINERTQREVCYIQAIRRKTTLFESKFGGIPYWPPHMELPMNEGRTMELLAQINFSDVLQMKDFPAEGILQFFIDPDNLYGMNFDDPVSQKGFRIVYHAEIQQDVKEEEVIHKMVKNIEKRDSPVQGEYGLCFQIEKEGLSTSDYQFDALFTEIFNQRNPQIQIESFFDLPDEVGEEIYNSSDSKIHHQINGYPFFTQSDPREYQEEFQMFDVLLLQIDSDFTEESGNDIMWGDAGVGNFFISREDLKQLKFDRVLYNWDCS